MASYLLQTSQYGGTYRNPYKPGGRGVKFTEWVTVNAIGGALTTNDDVKKMWLEAFAGRDQKQIQRYRVTFKGKTVIDARGRVYAERTDPSRPSDKWMGYVETLPGCEEL